MNRLELNGLHLWQFENLAGQPSIKHFVTDRSSHPGDREFTLSLSSTPDKDHVNGNRKLLATALGISADRLVFPSQVHETRIVHVTAETQKSDLLETDALITHEPGICVCVMSADCVPILLFDKKNNAVAAVHSGWRGTVALILTKTLHVMRDTFNTKGKDLIAGIGPSVSQQSYEVGEEVINEVARAFGSKHELTIPQPNNKAKLDLWRANEIQLLDFGVPANRIEISDLCTVKNNQYFFSARKGDAGRFAAGIMLS